MTGTATFLVTGLTCDHCAKAVTTELARLPGVSHIRVELVPAGETVVTVASEEPLDRRLVTAALDEAGDYQLAGI